MKNDKVIIKCPYCGAEYLPSEIFYPEDFIPEVDVIKDEAGKIVVHDRITNEAYEEYTCDVCDHTFKVKMKVSVEAEKCDEHDFNYDTITKVSQNKREELKED